MNLISNEGLAIILDKGSQATRNNVKRFIEENKDVSVYELSQRGNKYDRWIEDVVKEILEA